MTKINIYLATRRRLAMYMDYIHRTYYDTNMSIKWDVKFNVVSDYKHEALAVLNFAYVLGAMSDSKFEYMYDRFTKFARHYEKKIMDKVW